MKCGQTPSRQQMQWLNAKEDMVPGEFQLGLCKLVNPYKKKSGFSLTPHVHRDLGARCTCLFFGLYP